MMTLSSQFDKALTKIEINGTKRARAVKAHLELRAVLESNAKLRELGIQTVLIGSYARETGIYPGRDVDVFVKLTTLDTLANPHEVFKVVCQVLVDAFGQRAEPQRRSIKVSFDFDGDGFAIDAVPAVRMGERWALPNRDREIWDNRDRRWIETDPEQLGALTESATSARRSPDAAPTSPRSSSSVRSEASTWETLNPAARISSFSPTGPSKAVSTVRAKPRSWPRRWGRSPRNWEVVQWSPIPPSSSLIRPPPSGRSWRRRETPSPPWRRMQRGPWRPTSALRQRPGAGSSAGTAAVPASRCPTAAMRLGGRSRPQQRPSLHAARGRPVASDDIDTLDPASLDAFRDELIESGFEPVEEDPRFWSGPIHRALSQLTVAETMLIQFQNGWPYRPPKLYVKGIDSDHAVTDGEVCLFQPGEDAIETWKTFADYSARIAEWAESSGDGFRAEDALLDAHLYYRNSVAGLATLKLGSITISDSDTEMTGKLYGTWRHDRTLLELSTSAPEGDAIAGRWYYRRALESGPPRDLIALKGALTKGQLANFERRLKNVEHGEPMVFALVWEAEGGRTALALSAAPARRDRNRSRSRLSLPLRTPRSSHCGPDPMSS